MQSDTDNNKAEVWIGTGWKMNKTLAEARAYASALLETEGNADPRIQRFVLPPFTVLHDIASALYGSDVLVGAQNLHWQDEGAWTGEISAPMLVDCGAHLVEIGHSERREHFGEADETVGLKVAAALRHGLIPLVCVGETQEQKAQADKILETQVLSALADVPKNTEVLFAYEPVWAIGDGGTPAEPAYANERQTRIKAIAGARLEMPTRCLYGGSVNAVNCTDFIKQPKVDGLFIGRAAWDPSGYLDILQRCSEVLSERNDI